MSTDHASMTAGNAATPAEQPYQQLGHQVASVEVAQNHEGVERPSRPGYERLVSARDQVGQPGAAVCAQILSVPDDGLQFGREIRLVRHAGQLADRSDSRQT
jgi:hypothetical protein